MNLPNRQGCCPCSYISPGVMRKSDLRSSLSLNVFVLNWFYVFERFILIVKKESLRRWTFKQHFFLNFKKRRESLRRWTLKQSQEIFDEKKLGCELIFFHFFCVYYLPVSLKKTNFHDISDRLELNLTNNMKLPTISEEDKCTQNIIEDP